MIKPGLSAKKEIGDFDKLRSFFVKRDQLGDLKHSLYPAGSFPDKTEIAHYFGDAMPQPGRFYHFQQGCGGLCFQDRLYIFPEPPFVYVFSTEQPAKTFQV